MIQIIFGSATLVKPKTHQTALAIVPPRDVWAPIQAIREKYDRQFYRWMPHINLLYPFYQPHLFTIIAPLLENTCRTFSPFEIVLREFRYFVHRGRGCTVWLAPEPAENVVRLQTQLQAVCPECDELNRFPHGFVPHLSVGQAVSPKAAQELAAELARTWLPLHFEVRDVAILQRGRSTPFVVALRIPLGEPNSSATPSPTR